MASSLHELNKLYLNEHRSHNCSEKNISHYQDTFQRFEQFLIDTARPVEPESLTLEVPQAFAIWLKDTPRRAYRGSTNRSIHGIHGNLKDLKSFTRWLHQMGYLEQPVAVPSPKLPGQLFPRNTGLWRVRARA